MRNSIGVLLLLVAAGAAQTLNAQETASKLELYGGYNYIRFNINANVAGQPPSQTFNGNGGGGQMVYNVNNWLGVLGDVGSYWATNSTAQGAAIPYLFAKGKHPTRHSYALCSGSSRRSRDEFRDRGDRMAKPFRDDWRRGNRRQDI